MNRIFKLEIKRAFRNRLFAAALCVAFAIFNANDFAFPVPI